MRECPQENIEKQTVREVKYNLETEKKRVINLSL